MSAAPRAPSPLLSLLLLSTMLSATPALAQQTDPEGTAESATGQAEAVTENIGADIVVTARRREEKLIDVPISLTVVTGEALDNQGALDITFLQRQTPNFTIETARGSNSTLIAFIRGVGQQDPLWGFEPGVGLYVDDVYIARPQGAVLDIFDVARTEVLRGPQGTLYGRNTIGGAIKYVTNRLGNDLAFQGRAMFGSYDQVDLIGRFVAPVTSKLSVGGAVAWYNRDGYGENLVTGEDNYNKDVLGFRGSAEWQPNERLFIRIAGDRTADNSNPRHGHREVGNGGLPAFEPPENEYDTAAGILGDQKVVTWGVSGTVEYMISDEWAAKSITAWRQGYTDTIIDFDSTQGPILDVPAFYNDDQFTQEVQLLWNSERFQGVAGFFYLNGTAAGAFDTVLGLLNTTIFTSGSVDTSSVAFYGDVTWNLSEKWILSGGLRWTQDKKTGTVYRQNFTGIRSPEFGNPGAIPGLVRTDYTNSRTDSKLTPRFTLTYQFNPDVNAYVSYAEGFKSGGFDMRGDAILTPTTVEGYAPETLNSVEAGLKGNFLENSLYLALAGFYSKYNDQQVTIQVPSIAGGIASFVDNAGKAVIWGFEAEAIAQLPMGFSWNLGVGYTNADYKEFLTYIFGGTTPVDVADQRWFQNTPSWTINTSVTWTGDVFGGQLLVMPMLYMRSGYQLFEVRVPELDEPGGYVLFDFSVNWIAPSERWKLGFYARNLTDARYRTGGYNFPGAAFGNSITGFYGAPRTFSGAIEFRY
jgi:iron complex outermembrane receptor protein